MEDENCGGPQPGAPAARQAHRDPDRLHHRTRWPGRRNRPRDDSQIGCHIERFLAPVEPGNLFLLGYKDEVPIVSAPGCFRSAKPNVVDLVLPPMLARYRVSDWEVACLGHGGLLG